MPHLKSCRRHTRGAAWVPAVADEPLLFYYHAVTHDPIDSITRFDEICPALNQSNKAPKLQLG